MSANEKIWRVPGWNNYEVSREKTDVQFFHLSRKFAEMVKSDVPESGNFCNVGIGWLIDRDAQPRWVLQLEVSASLDDKNLRDLCMSVLHRDSDLMVSNYIIFNGTNDDIIRYLEGELLADSTLDIIAHLLESLYEKIID